MKTKLEGSGPGPEISLSQARRWFRYCADGSLVWAEKIAGKVVVGKAAGYIFIGVNGRQYRAHRLVWFIYTGSWPNGEIDHINGVRTDNRIENLRDVTDKINSQNVRKAHCDTASKLLGAYFDKRCQKWYSVIAVNGKTRRIPGWFDTAQAAHCAFIDQKRLHHEGNTL